MLAVEATATHGTRHRQIPDVVKELNANLQTFLQNNKTIANLTKDRKEKDLKKMSEAGVRPHTFANESPLVQNARI